MRNFPRTPKLTSHIDQQISLTGTLLLLYPSQARQGCYFRMGYLKTAAVHVRVNVRYIYIYFSGTTACGFPRNRWYIIETC